MISDKSLTFILYMIVYFKIVKLCLIPGCKCPEGGASLLCSGINMQEIPFRDNNNNTEDVSFDSISVSDNLIENLPANSLGRYKAKDVNLSHNPLSAMSPRAFEQLADTLEILDLSHCQLLTIHWATFPGLSLLKEIRLNNNSLEDFPSGLFDELTLLTKLDLSENLVTELSRGIFNGLGDLAILNLSKNQIYWIEEGTFDHLYRLMHLDLSGNKLSVIDKSSFVGLDVLKYFNLSDNGLQSLPKSTFLYVPRVEIVDISKNPLESIDGSSFGDSPSLRELYISQSGLRKVTPGAYLTGLEMLDVSSNLLETLIFSCKSHIPNSVNIDSNPLVCNCSLHWLSVVKQDTAIQGSCTQDRTQLVKLQNLNLQGCAKIKEC